MCSRVLSIAAQDLLWALSACAAYLLLQWLLALPPRNLLALGAALGAAAASTIIRSIFSLRLTLLGAAVLADGKLALKERVSTAGYLGGDQHPGAEAAWAELVQKDGERALRGVDVRRQFPIRLPRLARWILAPAGLAILFASLPPIDMLGLMKSREVEAAMRREVDRKRNELEEKIEEIRKKAERQPDPEVQKALDALKKRPGEEQLAKPEEPKPAPSGEEAKQKALVEFARLEDVLKKQLERSDFQGLKEFLDRFPPGALSKTPLTGAIRQALKAGDFAKAMAELKGLQADLAALSDKKSKDGALSKEELERMKKLSEELKRLARDSDALKKLSEALSSMSRDLELGDLPKGLEDLQSLDKDLQDLASLMEDMKLLESSLDLAQLSLDELSKLHRCPNCGKLSMNPGGT